jgi:hypothetical protein
LKFKNVDRSPTFTWEEVKEASTSASPKLFVWITGRGSTLGVDFSASPSQRLPIVFGKNPYPSSSIDSNSGSWQEITKPAPFILKF